MTRKLIKSLVAVSVAATVAVSCGQRKELPLPFPVAYPRPLLPDTVLVETPGTPLRFMVNSEALVSSSREGWYDISYPMLGATVFLTFSPVETNEIENIKENRMERLMLNAGERPVDFSEFKNPAGFDIVAASSEGSLTPFQFIATDNLGWVVSGAVYFSSPEAAVRTDSIRPLVKAISYDLMRALSQLDYQK